MNQPLLAKPTLPTYSDYLQGQSTPTQTSAQDATPHSFNTCHPATQGSRALPHPCLTMQVNDELEVPLELDTAAILASLPPLPPVVDSDSQPEGLVDADETGTGHTAKDRDSARGGDGVLGGVYDLEGIFMHSGTATGGHYTAFLLVRDSSALAAGGGATEDRGAPQGRWYWFNDAGVSPVGGEGEGDGEEGTWGSVAEMLRQASGKRASSGGEKEGAAGIAGAAGVGDDSGDVVATQSEKSSPVSRRRVTSSVVASSSSSSSNTSAYMLVYRRRGPDGACDQGGASGGHGEGGAETPNLGLPADCVAMVEQENDSLVKLRRLEAIQKRIVTVRAWGSRPPAEDGGGWGCVDEERDVVVEVLDSTSFAALSLKVAAALGLEMGTLAENGAVGGPGERWRLRRYNRYKGVGEETFGGREGLSLQELELGPTCCLLLERQVCVCVPFVCLSACCAWCLGVRQRVMGA